MKTKKSYDNQLIETFNNKYKTAWNIIRNVLHKSTKDNYIPAMFKRDYKTIRSKYVADVFNEYF
jgi:hypothetical protein